MQPQEIKERYKSIVPNKYNGDYECNRWFKTLVDQVSYSSTKKTIERIVGSGDYSFKRYLEVGPGPGTWTKLFLKQDAQFMLVDISKEMLMLAEKNLSEHKNISFVENDFLVFQSESKYDFFFSSRALEYFPEKHLFLKKVYELLSPQCKGILITKTPHYSRYKLMGKKVPAMHRGQVNPFVLKKLLKKSGFENISLYPATFTFPLLRSHKANRFLYFVLGSIPLTKATALFTESYAVTFSKP